MISNVVDLFAGIGGMSKAFTDIGAKVIWANDFDKSACEVYKTNNANVELVQADIREIDLTKIPDFDILTSTFPIQPFSTTGVKKRFKHNEPLIAFIFNVIKFKQPNAFLFETDGIILTHDKGLTFKVIKEELERLEYNVCYKVLNIKDYCNIPHNKKKMYIVGFKSDTDFNKFSFPEPIELTKSFYDIVDVTKKQENDYYVNENSKSYFFLKENLHENEKCLIYKRGSEFKTLNFKSKDIALCPAIHAFSINNYYLKDNFGMRKLTVQEYLNLHGYNGYKIPDNLSKSKLYRMISAASLYPIIHKISNNIIKAMNKEEVSITEGTFRHTGNVSNTTNKSVASENNFESLLYKVENENDSFKKGKALEALVKVFFEKIEGFKVDTNIKTETEEIDILISNESKSEYWKKESLFILAECKNWTGKCGKPELVLFQEKIRNRRKRVGVGFFISWNGFTSTFKDEDLRGSREDILVIPIEGRQIKEAIQYGDIEHYVKNWHKKSVMT